MPYRRGSPSPARITSPAQEEPCPYANHSNLHLNYSPPRARTPGIPPDRSIDRKVRILLRLRKDFTDLLVVPPSEDDGGVMEDIESGIESDIMSYDLQGVEAVENSKMKEQCANVIENKGPALGT